METKTVHHPRQLYEIPAHDVEYINVANLREYLDAHPPDPNKVFTPRGWYNRDGDNFEIYWINDRAFEETRGDLTLMKSISSHEIVGVKFYGVKKLMGLVEVKEEEPIREDLMEHKWKLGTASLSSDWRCEKCDEYATGGPHDGGPYYPQRGQEVTSCYGSPEKRREVERKKYEAEWTHKGVEFSVDSKNGWRFDVPSLGAHGAVSSRDEAIRMAKVTIEDSLRSKGKQ